MKKIKRITTSLFTVFTGMLTGSMLITHSETWKIYLPILLIVLSVRLTFEDFDV
jgi:hypothetical protein